MDIIKKVIESIIEFIGAPLTWIMKSFGDNMLDFTFKMYNDLMKISIAQFTKDIASFSAGALNVVREYSGKVALPIAVMILIFAFAQEVYNLQVENNNAMSLEDNIQKMAIIFIRFILTILLVKYSIDILLKIFEITQNLLLKVNQNVEIIANGLDNAKAIVSKIDGVGMASIILLIIFLLFIIMIFASAVIVGVAYSRVIMIYILLCFSPIALATFISKNSWLSSIWQNFAKNIFALSLQGLIISLIIRITGGLFTTMNQVDGAVGLVLLAIIAVVGALSIVKSLSFGKTLMGLN